MGTRINYIVKADNSADAVPCAILYSNSSDDSVDAEAIFKDLATKCIGANSFLSELSYVRYRPLYPDMDGYRVFVFDSAPYDNERIIEVSWDYTGEKPVPVFVTREEIPSGNEGDFADVIASIDKTCGFTDEQIAGAGQALNMESSDLLEIISRATAVSRGQ